MLKLCLSCFTTFLCCLLRPVVHQKNKKIKLCLGLHVHPEYSFAQYFAQCVKNVHVIAHLGADLPEDDTVWTDECKVNSKCEGVRNKCVKQRGQGLDDVGTCQLLKG